MRERRDGSWMAGRRMGYDGRSKRPEVGNGWAIKNLVQGSLKQNLFSERQLTFTFAVGCRSSVCLSSVCNVGRSFYVAAGLPWSGSAKKFVFRRKLKHFYSASALLAIQSAVLARGILSVCPSVCPSVTVRYCVQTNEDTIVRFSASGRTIPLVSGEVKFIRIFAGHHPQRGR